MTRRRLAGALAGAGLALCLHGTPASAQTTHLLLVTGVSGDPELATAYHAWAVGIVEAAKKAGVADADITYLAENPEADAPRIRGKSTREGVTKAFVDVAGRARPGDAVFVLLIGHGTFDGRVGAFNLPGPDLTSSEFADLVKKFDQQRVVFVNTTSSSGAFLEALKGPNRIVVTATKTGGERLDTRFPEFFVKALTTTEADQDRNGRVSVGEAFAYAQLQVQNAYEKTGHIQTEHPALDDGADGKLASTVFLAPEGKARAEIASVTDPALRALLEEQDTLERQVAALRLKKGTLPEADYDSQLETLLTDLALKARQVREAQAKR